MRKLEERERVLTAKNRVFALISTIREGFKLNPFTALLMLFPLEE
jgi:hypothetical protein